MTPKPSLYIETSVISYLTSRMSRDLIVAAHQQVTRAWWDLQREEFQLFVSSIVIAEISIGDPVQSEKRLAIIREETQLIEPTKEAIELARILIREGALPAKAADDAAHVAIAAVTKIQYLLTWNCKHIANVRMIPVIMKVCEKHGYQMPLIYTPLEFIGADND